MFTIDTSGVQVQSLDATAGRSQIRGRGIHLDFSKLEAKGNYDLNIDLAEVAAITRQPQIKGGRLHLTGNGLWSPQGFCFDRRLRCAGHGMAAQNIFRS